MLHRQMGEQLVAKETLGKDSSGSGGEGAMTTTTVALLQFVANDLFTDWLNVNNGAGFSALGVQGTATIRTLLRSWHQLLAGDFLAGNLTAAMTAMTGFCPTPASRVFLRRIGFERHFG